MHMPEHSCRQACSKGTQLWRAACDMSCSHRCPPRYFCQHLWVDDRQLKRIFRPSAWLIMLPSASNERSAAATTASDDDKPLLVAQVMNLWERDADVRKFVFGTRLARIAAELMG